jgi:hypothetical protein
MSAIKMCSQTDVSSTDVSPIESFGMMNPLDDTSRGMPKTSLSSKNTVCAPADRARTGLSLPLSVSLLSGSTSPICASYLVNALEEKGRRKIERNRNKRRGRALLM